MVTCSQRAPTTRCLKLEPYSVSYKCVCSYYALYYDNICAFLMCFLPEGDETGVMDSLMEALQSGAAFRDRRKRTPRNGKTDKILYLGAIVHFLLFLSVSLVCRKILVPLSW